MMLEHIFNSSFLYSLSLTLVHFLWQGLLVALVLKSALLIFSNKKPQLRYGLATLAMLVNLLLPIITFIKIYSAEVAYNGSTIGVLTLTDLIYELKQPDALFSYQELSEFLPSFLPYIAVFWFAAVILLASKMLLEIYNVNKLPHQGSVEPNAQLLARFNELANQINLSIPPRLLISLKVDVPMAIGWLKPVVLIPATMVSGLNSAQLEMLILHELAHIRRHDYLVNFLQTFVEILLFFHPAVLWVSKQMRNEREYCSDDIAVQHCGDAVAYAHTLADTASLCTKSHHNHTIPSMAMAASGGDLKQRVVRLVDHHCAPQNNISKWLASATIIFSILLLSSKQLLTMPLLDIWHNEIPFKTSSDSPAEPSKINNLIANINDRFNGDKLPTTSIAKELLTPPTQIRNEPVEQQAHIETSKTTNSTLNTASQQTTLITQIEKDSKEIIASYDNQSTTQLDNLTPSKHQPVIKNTDLATNNSSAIKSNSMVEQAFEKTDSKKQFSTNANPYAQELADLATSEVTNQATAAQITPLPTQTTLLSTSPQAASKVEQSLPSPHEALFIAQQNEPEMPSSNATLNNLGDSLKESSVPVWHDAKQLKSVNPVYPNAAKRKGIEIEIKVNFTIDVNGDIKDIQFARHNKIYYFKSSILSAIKQWRFSPAKYNNKAVESQMSKVFAFSLQS